MTMYRDSKKVLLIGGEGFIGRNISDVISGRFDCYSLGIKKSLFPERKDVYINGDPYVDYVGKEFDVYIHLIDNMVEPDIFTEKEKSLLEHVGMKKGKHLILFSSAVVYVNPESSYGIRKVLLEKIYEEYCKEHGINLTILRLFNIYGKYQLPYRQGSLIANILYNYLNDTPIEINDMQARRDFMYAGDMGKVVLWVIENKFFGKMDLATGKLISVKDLLRALSDSVFLKKMEVVNKNIKENNLCPLGDAKLFSNITPVSLSEGLNDALSFYKKHDRVIKKYFNI